MKLTRLISPTLALLALAACQKAPEPNPDAKPGLSVSDGVLVLPAVKGNPGAAYFTLANGSDKAASLAAVSIDGATKAEMHETMGGSMAPLAALEVKADESVKFERGGKHVMVFELAPTVSAGGSVEMTLTFADGDKLSAPLKVEAVGGDIEHMH
jgi:copper(I)-binding protein